MICSNWRNNQQKFSSNFGDLALRDHCTTSRIPILNCQRVGIKLLPWNLLTLALLLGIFLMALRSGTPKNESDYIFHFPRSAKKWTNQTSVVDNTRPDLPSRLLMIVTAGLVSSQNPKQRPKLTLSNDLSGQSPRSNLKEILNSSLCDKRGRGEWKVNWRSRLL